jgi:hypothetical protein
MGWFVAFFYNLDDSFQVFFGHLTSGSQEKVLTHRSSPNTAGLQYRLGAHGFPDELSQLQRT